MNIFEAGIISGAPTGAAIGGVICQSHGILGIAGGSCVGLVSGGVAGWLYAVIVIGLLSVVGGIWRGARKRDLNPSATEMQKMSSTAIHGIFMGALFSFVFWIGFGWLPAVVAAFAIVSVYTFIAVARCESQ